MMITMMMMICLRTHTVNDEIRKLVIFLVLKKMFFKTRKITSFLISSFSLFLAHY